jgi:transposase InsO family protein
VKYALIKELANVHSVVRLCHALTVSRSGYYLWRSRLPSARDIFNQRLAQEMRRIHTDVLNTYGSPRMYVELKELGYDVGRGRVERLMRKHGIQAQQTKRHKRTYQVRAPQTAEPNILNRQFSAGQANKKWVSDITFIETAQGWLYLAVVLDLYSRAIVGWSMSSKPNATLVRNALKMAISQRAGVNGALVHSDQGSQYKAASYRADLAEHDMVCSMSRKGECHDNAVAESFFHTIKNELVHARRFKTRDEAKQAIFKYIELFYNRRRRHSYLNYQAPLVYENMNAVA